eukprot:TRINITY_DN541_c0_g1_i4.p1 TRINITY_DN541_c0_g1~~TRINITY_DN541_c0_g1_i4.p1  ORF type:complete len:344 (-),score=44.78 TRINITY_DN541_c0_g1_i4:149-1180(-)
MENTTQQPAQPTASTDDFPFQKSSNYKDIKQIIADFPHLENINQFNQRNYSEISNAKCFIIRSNNDDDVHKAIKYGIWTSTQRNIDKLNEVFQECKSTKTEIFLFFSVVKSGQFEGVAKLISHVQPINFPYWWQAGKWRSLVKIEWLFIKDVAYQKFQGILNKEGQPITHSRDGSELDWLSNGQKMMQAFVQASNDNTILHDFEELDERELNLRKKIQAGYPNYSHSYKSTQNQYQQPQQQQQQYQQMMMNSMAMFWQYQQMMATNYYNQMPMQQQLPQQQQQDYQQQQQMGMAMPMMGMQYQQPNQMYDQGQQQQQPLQQQQMQQPQQQQQGQNIEDNANQQ